MEPFHERCKQAFTDHIKKNTKFLPIVDTEGFEADLKYHKLEMNSRSPIEDAAKEPWLANLLTNIPKLLETYFPKPVRKRSAILIETSEEQGYIFIMFTLYERK